jgi:hypothetical protein
MEETMLMLDTRCAVLTHGKDGTPTGALLPAMPAQQSLRAWQATLDSLLSAWMSNPDNHATLPGVYVVTARNDDGVIVARHGHYAEDAYAGLPLPEGTVGLLAVHEPELRLGCTRAVLALNSEAVTESDGAALASVATPYGDLMHATALTKQDFAVMRMSARELTTWLETAPLLP